LPAQAATAATAEAFEFGVTFISLHKAKQRLVTSRRLMFSSAAMQAQHAMLTGCLRVN
jgi:hypothetical protein